MFTVTVEVLGFDRNAVEPPLNGMIVNDAENDHGRTNQRD
jgi:hypothetical protein